MKLSLSRLRLPKASSRLVARLLVLCGAAVLSAGVGMVFVPAGVIALGVALIAVGLLFVDMGARS